MTEADKMWDNLGYDKWIDNRKAIHFIHRKKEKDFTFMDGNCFSIKRPTKDEQEAMDKTMKELGWL